MKIDLNTSAVRALLRKRYAPTEWAFLEEVPPATGGGASYADAVAVNLWRSRGLSIYGFEIKVSRGDWLREIKRPAKAEGVFNYCDGWYVVALPGIVQPGELPAAWGLIEARSATRLVEQVAAPRLSPQPVDRAFFASLIRRAYESLDAMAELKLRGAVTDARAAIDEQIHQAVAKRSTELAQIKESIAAWEVATGLRFDRYSGPPKDVIQLAQELLRLQHRSYGYSEQPGFAFLEKLADDLHSASDLVRNALHLNQVALPPVQQSPPGGHAPAAQEPANASPVN